MKRLTMKWGMLQSAFNLHNKYLSRKQMRQVLLPLAREQQWRHADGAPRCRIWATGGGPVLLIVAFHGPHGAPLPCGVSVRDTDEGAPWLSPVGLLRAPQHLAPQLPESWGVWGFLSASYKQK